MSIKQPSQKELIDFHKQAGVGNCGICGGRDRYDGAQAVHPFWRKYPSWDYDYICLNCRNDIRQKSKTSRAEYMKSLPRCEYCNRRGLHLVGAKSLTIERALLCGAHYKKAQVRARVAAGLAFWLNWDVNGDDVRAMMQEAI